ncbi:unnamed protein product [Rotaria sordida]|uniref:Uncharacterized protein n=1 Tax=Rotaria sordida TaxID=392033 RepID=A0A814DXP5_9BILA|nr:unnamed protein product [Rotaria sordida]
MGLLPAYIDKIEELSISEQDTPDQVYAFLSVFPSFELFKQLRTLYFHFNGEAIDWPIVERALNSLSQTTIDTLSIKAMNTDNRSSLGNVIINLFGLKSLKRFSFRSKIDSIKWSDLTKISSNIEHLTISGIHFRFQDLQYISKCAPHLKYLDVDLINIMYPYHDEAEMNPKKSLILMSTLRTLVLYFQRDSSITMDMLRQYFNCMPLLNRLEIKAHTELLDGNVWKMLLETSLPLLTHFTLRTTTFRVEEVDLHHVLASFQSSYWISKKNFNIIITKHEYSDFNGFGIDKMKYNVRYEFDWPVIQCWIAPDRTDLLRAFTFQLNQRFNALITQCQRLRFDFIQCHKDDFRFCMGLLPAYIDKIQELAISEQDTPGQVYAFLSFFPSFELFKQLRTLYFHFNGEGINWNIVERALNSLSKIRIDSLSINAMETDDKALLENVIINLFGLKSLKRFSLRSKMRSINWADLKKVSSNIEHLTISGINFEFEDLQYIFKCAPSLKYLDVELIDKIYFHYNEKKERAKKNILPMLTLHTLVLYFEQDSSITIDMLAKYFNAMPVLKRLEIKAHNEILDGNVWKMLLETSLPLLNHFTLRTTTSRVQEAGKLRFPTNRRASFSRSMSNHYIFI